MLKIVVMPVKNEAWILEKTLSCFSLWADHIIIADQKSDDGSREIYKKFPKVTVIENRAQYHSSNVRKLLLDTARGLDGNNAIFSFDADEIPTVHMLEKGFWQQVESLPTGTSLQFEWVNLWRSPLQYRMGNSQFTPSWKHFGFVDDRNMSYDTLNVINDHTSRIPTAAHRHSKRFDLPKVLHYQFVVWDRLLSKQALYRTTEFLQRPQTWLEALKINIKYYPSKDERGLVVARLASEWIEKYREQGIDVLHIPSLETNTFDQQVIQFIIEKGPAFFRNLDIWDIPWNEKIRKIENGFRGDIKDPRGVFIKAVHRFLVPLLSAPFFTRVYVALRRINETP